MARIFETIVALIPAVVFLSHLTIRSAAALPEKQTAETLLTMEVSSDFKPPQRLEIVPEPSSLAFCGLGGMLLFYFRRRKMAPGFPTGIPLRQPSKIATDVA